jgi:hypothetical protein
LGEDPREQLVRIIRTTALGPGCAKIRVFNSLVESSSQFGQSEPKSAADGYPMKVLEKTVLGFLGSRTFSHGLGREPPSEPGTKRMLFHRQLGRSSPYRLPVFVSHRSFALASVVVCHYRRQDFPLGR